MLLKWVLNLLLAFFVYRLVRGIFGKPREVRARRQGGSGRLDPDRAVRASWSEVRERGEGDGTG